MTKQIIKLSAIAFFLLMPGFALANEFPAFPMMFYGEAKKNGQSLPAGTKILAYDGTELIGEVVLPEAGIYGYDNPFKVKLMVGKYSGQKIVFKFVEPNKSTEQTGTSPQTYNASFEEGKAVSLNFNFIIPAPSSGGGSSSGGGGGGGSYIPPQPVITVEPILEVEEILETIEEDIIVLGVEYVDESAVDEIIKNTIAKERELMGEIDNKLTNRIKGRILLQVQERGEAWYVNPKDSKKYYMANGYWAYQIMRFLGVGITNKDLERIHTDKDFAKKHSGKIFLQVEERGEAFYIDINGQAHYLKDGIAAYEIMRNLGLGITNNDLRKIDVGEI
jgi:hypothetical protein